MLRKGHSIQDADYLMEDKLFLWVWLEKGVTFVISKANEAG